MGGPASGTRDISSAASGVYKRQHTEYCGNCLGTSIIGVWQLVVETKNGNAAIQSEFYPGGDDDFGE